MRALYEHGINDIEKDYARKYGVDISKVHFDTNDLILRVDMSETERLEQNPCEDREESKAYCAECDHIEMCSWYPHDGCEWLKTDRYNAGYNAAKREIALSGEYERAYERGKQDAEQTRWIPVSEGLPKSAGVYIVTREFTDGFECADLADACYFDGTSTWHNDNRINHGREYVDKKIKAWMPLPEPYRGESEVSE